jgi:hypothetical protein
MLIVRVRRETSDLPPPANITNKIGQIILGQFDANGDEHLQFSKHLFVFCLGSVSYHILDTPLVKDFPITSGSVNVVCPSVPAGKYFLVRTYFPCISSGIVY